MLKILLEQFTNFSIFSVAKVGEPAATKPTIGYASGSMLESLLITEIPRDAPLSIDINPFFSKARRCVSAEFGDLKPS